MSAIESSFQQYKDHNFLNSKIKVMVKIPKGVQVVLDDIYILRYSPLWTALQNEYDYDLHMNVLEESLIFPTKQESHHLNMYVQIYVQFTKPCHMLKI